MDYLQYYSVYEFVQDYKHGYLSRREMMKRVLGIAGGVASAASILTLLGCGGAAQTPAGSATGDSPAPALARAVSPAASLSATAPSGISAPSPEGAPGPASAAPNSSAAAAGAVSPVAGSSAGASSAAPAQVTSVVASNRGLTAVPNAKSPISVPPNDPSIDAHDLTMPANGTNLMWYEARPAGASGPLPVVLVVEENMGLTEHIKDVARRWAKQGYVGAALDLLSRQGGTAAVTDRSTIPGILSNTSAAANFVQDFKALADYYLAQPGTKPGSLGINGFCFGGGIVWLCTEGISSLKAAVPFYGAAPPLAQVPAIKAAVYGVYSADPKDFANNNRDQLEQAAKAAGVIFEWKAYPGTMHAFNNDTGPAYNQAQALAAWSDATAWMNKYLKA